jgi:DNA-binding transcriptional regulator YdaS (Cro superfamily)
MSSTPLARYMKAEEIDDAAFATLIGKDRSIVNRIRRGLMRPTLDVAAAIESKTGGAVPMQAWIPTTPRRERGEAGR